jgi:PadR family transcriptional regulator PadR
LLAWDRLQVHEAQWPDDISSLATTLGTNPSRAVTSARYFSGPRRLDETISSPKRLMDKRKEILLREERENPGELLQGTLDLLILKALARGGMHGYGVAEWIHQTSEDVLKVEEGALYPALHRLELRGLLSSEWGTSDNNRRAKFYSLTASGKKQLAQETEFWQRMSGAVARILQTA